jgi:hypothetical protein
LLSPAARVAGLALFETGSHRRLAVANLVIALFLGHQLLPIFQTPDGAVGGCRPLANAKVGPI